MKKLIVLIIIGLFIYSGYEYFVKGVNVFEKLMRKPEVIVKPKEEPIAVTETKKPVSNVLIFDLEIGKHVTVKSASLPEGDIRLLGVDEGKQSCILSIYKSQGTVTKGMDLRRIVKNKWTLEVKLISVKASSAMFSLSQVSNPEDTLMILSSGSEQTTTSKTAASGSNEFVVTLEKNNPVTVKSKNLSYGTITLGEINHFKNECNIWVYKIQGKLSMNSDYSRRIGNVTVRGRLISLNKSNAKISFTISDTSDKFERSKEK